MLTGMLTPPRLRWHSQIQNLGKFTGFVDELRKFVRLYTLCFIIFFFFWIWFQILSFELQCRLLLTNSTMIREKLGKQRGSIRPQ